MTRIVNRIVMPDQSYLWSVLTYDPETGVLTWKPKSGSDRFIKTFNSRFAGKPAFTTMERGYQQGRIDGRLLYAHRVIWKLMTGDEPDDVDHINGDRSDNRWANLRNVSRTENMRNRRLSDANTSGVFGVSKTYWGAWQAKIGNQNRTVTIGSFRTKQEAVIARKSAEMQLGYHKNHGRVSA